MYNQYCKYDLSAYPLKIIDYYSIQLPLDFNYFINYYTRFSFYLPFVDYPYIVFAWKNYVYTLTNEWPKILTYFDFENKPFVISSAFWYKSISQISIKAYFAVSLYYFLFKSLETRFLADLLYFSSIFGGKEKSPFIIFAIVSLR